MIEKNARLDSMIAARDARIAMAAPSSAPAPTPVAAAAITQHEVTLTVDGRAYDLSGAVNDGIEIARDVTEEGVPAALRNLTSRKFLLSALTAGGLALTWLHGNIPGVVAGPTIGSVIGIYTIVEGLIDRAAAVTR